MRNAVPQSWACLVLQQLADTDGLICTTVLSCTSTADCALVNPGQEPSLPLHKAESLSEMQTGAAGRGGFHACMRQTQTQ